MHFKLFSDILYYAVRVNGCRQVSRGFHVDTDDANAFRLKQGQLLELVKEGTR